MGDTEAVPIEGALISAGPTQQEMARYSALRSAVDIAKQVPAGAGEDVESRTQVVLEAADQIYAWLDADTAKAAS